MTTVVPAILPRGPIVDARGYLTREGIAIFQAMQSAIGGPGTPVTPTAPAGVLDPVSVVLGGVGDGLAPVALALPGDDLAPVAVPAACCDDLWPVAFPAEAGGGGAVAWADVTGKPSTFAPEAHSHAIADVTGLQAALDAKSDEPTLFRYLATDRSGVNDANPQPWFDTANDAVTVEAAAYLMSGYLVLTSGTSSHSFGLLFAGTATVSLIQFQSMHYSGADNSSGTAQTSARVNRATLTTVTAANTTAGKTARIDGIVVFSGAGTFIPQFQYSAAPGSSTVKAGSFIALTKLGGVSKGTWA